MKKRLIFFVVFIIAVILTGCSGNKYKVESIKGGDGIRVRSFIPVAVSKDGREVVLAEGDSYQGMKYISISIIVENASKSLFKRAEDGSIIFPDGVEVTVEYEGKQYVGMIKPGVSIEAETVGDKTVFLFDSKVFKPK